MDPLRLYVGGELVPVRGVEMREEETRGGQPYPSLYLHVQFEGEVETTCVDLSVTKMEGGLAAIHEGLYERGMIPEWFYDGYHTPEAFEGDDG